MLVHAYEVAFQGSSFHLSLCVEIMRGSEGTRGEMGRGEEERVVWRKSGKCK